MCIYSMCVPVCQEWVVVGGGGEWEGRRGERRRWRVCHWPPLLSTAGPGLSLTVDHCRLYISYQRRETVNRSEGTIKI